MRKILLLFLSFFILRSFMLTQTIIENPEKPLSKKAGRTLKLEEVFRITDESGDFYFRYPGDLKVAPDGTIFIADEDQFLKFSSDGKFIGNLFRKGEGPGELRGYFGYAFDKKGIFIYDFMARKIIHSDIEGNLTDELRFKSESYNDFFGLMDGWFIFLKSVWPPIEERKHKLDDIKNTIFLISKDGKIKKEIHTFPKKAFFAPRAFTSLASFHSVLSDDNKKLFFSHTREYLIKLLDLDKGKILRNFKRKYPRMKLKAKNGWEEEFHKKYNVPKIKYESDIQDLFITKGLLWVITSTKDKTKGILIDVFNKEGIYVDNFYINLKGSLMATDGDYIFVKEADEDENFQIVKYKVIE